MYITKRGLFLVTTALASWCLHGCGTSQDAGKGATVPAQWTDQRLVVDVPMSVITFGLPEKTVVELRSQLTPLVVDHKVFDLGQLLPLDQEEHEADSLPPDSQEITPNPLVPTALYRVIPAPVVLQQEFASALQSAQIEADTYDANRIEDWLAQTLPAHGLAPDANAPTLVLLHLEAFGISGHHWKVQGRHGHLSLARVFGERHPLLVLDASAAADPYAGEGPYHEPAEPDDTEVLAQFVADASEFRLLQGPIYPVPTAPCHAVTAILAASEANLGRYVDLLPNVYDVFNPALIEQSLRNLAGDTPLYFDLKILSMPADDPVLDAISRGGGQEQHLEVMRTYFTLNWEQYHVAHPGCEGYLSVLFDGDAGNVPIYAGGIATYDDEPGRRISLSWTPDTAGLLFSVESPLCGPSPMCGAEGVHPDSEQIWNTLFSHETGHLMGQRHPHDIGTEGGDRSSNAFSSIWSSMSYQTGGLLVDFGAVDQANWRRNRAGYALLEASRAGREGSPEWNAALEAAGRLDWHGSWEALR